MFADWVHGPCFIDCFHQPCLPTMSTIHVSQPCSQPTSVTHIHQLHSWTTFTSHVHQPGFPPKFIDLVHQSGSLPGCITQVHKLGFRDYWVWTQTWVANLVGGCDWWMWSINAVGGYRSWMWVANMVYKPGLQIWSITVHKPRLGQVRSGRVRSCNRSITIVLPVYYQYCCTTHGP